MATKTLISLARRTNLESATYCKSSLTHQMIHRHFVSNWITAGAATRQRGHSGAGLSMKATVKKKKSVLSFGVFLKNNHPGG